MTYRKFTGTINISVLIRLDDIKISFKIILMVYFQKFASRV